MLRPQSAPPATGASAPPGAFSFRATAERPPPAPAPGAAAALSEAAIDAAWAALAGSAAAPRLAPKALLDRLKLFQPSATPEDAALLLGGEPFLTRELLCTLLAGNSTLFLLFDPLAAALAGGALGAPGELTFQQLRRLCEGLPGQGPLTEAAWQTLLAEGDADGDGRLGLEDVRALLRRATAEAASAAPRNR
jgi:hypothetical protein